MTVAEEPSRAEPAPRDEGPALRPGDTLGPYTVARFIARGGMGMVWAASLTGTRGFSKLFALKTILPSLADDPDYVKIFLDEANVAAQIQHPNVCQVFDFGTERNILYIAMEWIEGPSLGALLKARTARPGPPRQLDVGAAVRIVTDACAGLVAVHEQVDLDGNPLNVIHRDVTPQNILIAPDGHAKVADFGVARFAEQTHKKTATGIVKGKASYMAPEHMLASGIDQRCDIFSLGCVLYEVTVGRRPFEGRDVGTLLREVLRGEPKPPRTLVPGYSERLEAIVMRAIARLPDARYPTARAFRRDLEEWLATERPGVGAAKVASEMRELVGESLGHLRENVRASAREHSPTSMRPPARDALSHEGRLGGSGPSSSSASVSGVPTASVSGSGASSSGASRRFAAPPADPFEHGPADSTRIEGLRPHGFHGTEAPTETARVDTSASLTLSTPVSFQEPLWHARNQVLASLAVAAIAVGSVLAYVLTR